MGSPDYDAAGGGLLAGGLAYAGLFAVLSAILLVIGVTGFFVQESERLGKPPAPSGGPGF